MTPGDRSRDEVTSWARPGEAPLVPGIALLLADDIHRTWEQADEQAPPFWAFAWAGGQALARYVLDRPEVVRGRRVLDLASGSGLVAIAALRSGAVAVTASETDARARTALVLNASANGVVVEVVGDVVGAEDDDGVGGGDGGAAGAVVLDVDVVLAGDVFYEQPMARHMERFLDEAVAAGLDVLLGDPGREYLPRRRCTALATHDVPATADLEGRSTTPTTVWRFA